MDFTLERTSHGAEVAHHNTYTIFKDRALSRLKTKRCRGGAEEGFLRWCSSDELHPPPYVASLLLSIHYLAFLVALVSS